MSKDIHDMGAIAKDAAHEKLGELRDDATVYYERGRDKVQGAVSGFEQYVRDHPLRSILLAAGVGVACNYFWRRR